MSNGDFLVPFHERKRQANNFKTIMKITLDSDDYKPNNNNNTKENLKDKIFQSSNQISRPNNIRKRSENSVVLDRLNTDGSNYEFEKLNLDQKFEAIRSKGNIIKEYLNVFIKENEDKEFNLEELDQRLKNYSMAGTEDLKSKKVTGTVDDKDDTKNIRNRRKSFTTQSVEGKNILNNLLDKKGPLQTASFFTLTSNIKNNINTLTKQFKRLKTLEAKDHRSSRGSLVLKRNSSFKDRNSGFNKYSLKISLDSEKNIISPKSSTKTQNLMLLKTSKQSDENMTDIFLRNSTKNNIPFNNITPKNSNLQITIPLLSSTSGNNLLPTNSTANLLLIDNERKSIEEKSLSSSMKTKLISIEKKVSQNNLNMNNVEEIRHNTESFIDHNWEKLEDYNYLGGNTYKKISTKKIDENDDRELIRRCKVYDSLSDDEEDADFEWRIHPQSRFKEIWDLIILIITIYTLIFVPFTMAFFEESLFTFIILDIICDIIYILDLIFQFFIPFADNEDKYHTPLNEIASNYLFTWFILDFLSSLPMNSVLSLINYIDEESFDGNIGVTGTTTNKLYIGKKLTTIAKLTRMYRLMKLIRLVKLIKISKNEKMKYKIKMNFLEDLNISSNKRRMLIFFLYFIILNHMLACIWCYIGTLDQPNWLMTLDLVDQSNIDQYTAALYFNLYTVFTIGYGNITATNNLERIYSIIIMLVGILLYSFAVSSLANIIMRSDEKTLNFNKNLNYLEETRIKFNLPGKLFTKIKRYLSYDYNFNKIDKSVLFPDLPHSIRNDMLCQMYADIIKNFIFFRNTNTDFSARVLLSLRPTKVVHGDLIIKEGEFIEEMVFIKRGVLSVEKKYRGHFIKLVDLRRNEHFGEIAMLLNEKSNFTVSVKSKYSELFIMKKIDLIDICTEFHDIFEQISNRSAYNMLIIQKRFEECQKSIDKRRSLLKNRGSKLVKNHSKFFGKVNEIERENERENENNNSIVEGKEFELFEKKSFEVIHEDENEDEEEKFGTGNGMKILHKSINSDYLNEDSSSREYEKEIIIDENTSTFKRKRTEKKNSTGGSNKCNSAHKKYTHNSFHSINSIPDKNDKISPEKEKAMKTIDSFSSEQFLQSYINSPNSQKLTHNPKKDFDNSFHRSMINTIDLNTMNSFNENLNNLNNSNNTFSLIANNTLTQNKEKKKNASFSAIYKDPQENNKRRHSMLFPSNLSPTKNDLRRRPSAMSMNNTKSSRHSRKASNNSHSHKNSSPDIKMGSIYRDSKESRDLKSQIHGNSPSSNKLYPKNSHLSGLLKVNDPNMRRNTILINSEIHKNIKDGSKNIYDPNTFYSKIFDRWKVDEHNRKLGEQSRKLDDLFEKIQMGLDSQPNNSSSS